MTERLSTPNRKITRIIKGAVGAGAVALALSCSPSHQPVDDRVGEGHPGVASEQPASVIATNKLNHQLEKDGATTRKEKLNAVVKFACKTYGDDTNVLKQFDKDDYTGIAGLDNEDPKVAAVTEVYSMVAGSNKPLLEAMQRECDSPRLDKIVAARQRKDEADKKARAAYRKKYGALQIGNVYKQTEALDEATQFCQVMGGDYTQYLNSSTLPSDTQVNNFIAKLKRTYEETEQHPSDDDLTARRMPRDADGLQCPGADGDYGAWRNKWWPNRG